MFFPFWTISLAHAVIIVDFKILIGCACFEIFVRE